MNIITKNFPFLIPFVLIQLILMYPAYRLHWKERFWHVVNRKVKMVHNPVIFFAAIILINIATQIIFSLIGIDYTDSVNGLLLGVFMIFLPISLKGENIKSEDKMIDKEHME